MKKRMLSILCFVLCLVLVLPVAGATTADTSAADEIMKDVGAVNFTVMHTGDTNGIMAGDAEAIGFSKVATLTLDRAYDHATLLVDSGNALAGDAEKVIHVMENAQYTAAAIGTRDAALGIEKLQMLDAQSNFPLLCANWLKMDGELFWDPYMIVEVDRMKVGIIGLINPDIAEMYPEVTEGCNVYDPAAIANIYYEEMVQQGCTYFIALTSLGYEGKYTPRYLGYNCPWINLVLDSNTTEETVLDMGELAAENSSVVIFNLQDNFRQMGEIDITTGTADGMNTLLPNVYTAEQMSEVPDNEHVLFVLNDTAASTDPDTDAEVTVGEDGATVTVEKEGNNSALLYMLCFAAIIAATAGIIVFIMKKPAKKK